MDNNMLDPHSTRPVSTRNPSKPTSSKDTPAAQLLLPRDPKFTHCFFEGLGTAILALMLNWSA